MNNKNHQDLLEVSNYLLTNGVQSSILSAIKQNLGIEDPKEMSEIERSLKKTFQKINSEARAGPTKLKNEIK